MVPPAHLIDDVGNVMLVTGVTPPTLDQMAMAAFIEDATFERHLRAMRRRYRAKREVLVDALSKYLPEVRVSGTEAGLHLLAWLPDGADEYATAMRSGAPGSACTSFIATAPLTRHLLRRSFWASRFRVSPISWRPPDYSPTRSADRGAAFREIRHPRLRLAMPINF